MDPVPVFPLLSDAETSPCGASPIGYKPGRARSLSPDRDRFNYTSNSLPTLCASTVLIIESMGANGISMPSRRATSPAVPREYILLSTLPSDGRRRDYVRRAHAKASRRPLFPSRRADRPRVLRSLVGNNWAISFYWPHIPFAVLLCRAPLFRCEILL